MRYLISTFLLLTSLYLQAQESLLVLEFKGEEHTTWHGEEVGAIACGLFGMSCSVEYTSSFNAESFEGSIAAKIKEAFSINMSFSIFAPHAPRRDIRDLINGNVDRYEIDLRDYELALKTFHEEKQFLESLLKNNQDKVFVIAAGNGFALESMTIPGVVLSEKYALYPSFLDFGNTIKVAALESHELTEGVSDLKLAYYSTFSTEYVDIAAPVPLNTLGEVQRGTSFASPWVTGHIATLKKMYPELSSLLIKKLVMRSAYIPSIENTLKATLDFKKYKEKSLLYKAQHEDTKVERLKFVEDLGPGVLFVKSGGVLNPKVLRRCAELVVEGSFDSIDLACLAAHREIFGRSYSELNSTLRIWKLRNL